MAIDVSMIARIRAYRAQRRRERELRELPPWSQMLARLSDVGVPQPQPRQSWRVLPRVTSIPEWFARYGRERKAS